MTFLINLASSYVVVFLITLIPSLYLVKRVIKSIRTNGWNHRRTKMLVLLAVVVWFSPSIVTTIWAIVKGAPLMWIVVAAVVLFLLGSVSFLKKVAPIQFNSVVSKFRGKLAELYQVLLLIIVGSALSVRYLSHDDPKAISSVGTFRKKYVNWAKGSRGMSKELDQYDEQQTTIHVAVFLRLPFVEKQILGYGRLLFGCNQIREKYPHVLGGVEINPRIAVEISRLVVIKRLSRFRIRGTMWSLIIQMLIYRSFFQVCEARQVTEWWAILGAPLHELLKKFDFPFKEIDKNLIGKDDAGDYYAAKMDIGEGRQSVKAARPLLYRWFCSVLKKRVRFTRVDGRQVVPSTAEFHSSV